MACIMHMQAAPAHLERHASHPRWLSAFLARVSPSAFLQILAAWTVLGLICPLASVSWHAQLPPLSTSGTSTLGP